MVCFYLHVGGLDKALAISGMLTITVFIPFPFPSTCQDRVIQLRLDIYSVI